MYKPVNPKVSFPKEEERILKYWKEHKIFEKSISQRENSEEFVFYDGPPFATGLPHYGHLIAGTIKDIIPRYQTMKGKKVERRFGWDCHGLPVENLIETELGLNSKSDIEAYGIDKFNEKCRDSVLRYTKEWQYTVERMGRWVDFDHDYKTMDPDYMESIWWVLQALWKKGLVYEGHYILPYCPRCSTVLSNHELAQPGAYQDVHDQSITVRFKVTKAGKALKDTDVENGNTYVLAWTTTPWTLPSNLGLTAGPDIDYVKIKSGDAYYILAQARLGAYYKDEKDYEVIWVKKGFELLDMRYEPLFNYFEDLYLPTKASPGKPASIGAFRVLNGDFVSIEDGTGLVHTAPGFGEEDNKVFKGTGVPTICPIDAECKFTAAVINYQGRFVKDCDKDIIAQLKASGTLFKQQQILHSYPHCWRCNSPLIYRAIESWFVSVEAHRDALLKANDQIKWQPDHIKDGRFGKWLEGARDWAISRNRYWGNPLPIWKCPDCGETICIGSRKELQYLSGVWADDLHKHFVDKITIPCKKCDGTMTRINEVLDCWFESGSMPYAQLHYPFENKEFFEAHYPADFICEGLDQTRGWFYTLTVLAALLFNRPAFKNVIVNGLILAEDGKKMSKSLRNYTDPNEEIDMFGADAIRLYMMHSGAVRAEDLKFSDDGVRDVLKGVLIPLWNAYSFYVTYANIDEIKATGHAFDDELPTNPLDLWLLSITQKLVLDTTTAFDDYDISKAIDPIVTFIDQLNNWYIRRSRRRFWKSENDGDKKEAYETLYIALKTLTLVAAPVIPFITETIWINLHNEGEPVSVHLCDFPVYDKVMRDEAIEFKMATVQKAVSMGRSLRYQFNLKVRQPLKAVELVTRDPDEKAVLLEMEDSIREELNVKKVIFHEREDEMVEYRAKANFRILGKELGSRMKKASAIIQELDQETIASILEGSTLSIEVEDKTVELTTGKIIVERIEKKNLHVVNDGTLTVALDSEITPELKMEGQIRDLVRGVQNLRKDSGLDVSDRIKLYVGGDATLKKALELFKDYLCEETLTVDCVWSDSKEDFTTTVNVEDGVWKIAIEKIS